MKSVWNTLFKWMGKFEEAVTISALTVTVTVTIMNVFARYLFKNSIPWAQEVTGIGWTWTVMLGISWCYRRNMHMGIDLIVAKLGDKMKRVVYLTSYFILLIAFCYITYMSVIIASMGAIKLTSYFQIPYTYKYVSAVIAFTFMSLYTLRYLYVGIRRPEEFLKRVSIDGNGLDEINMKDNLGKEGGI